MMTAASALEIQLLTALLKEMTATMSDKYISVASHAAEYNWINQGVNANERGTLVITTS